MQSAQVDDLSRLRIVMIGATGAVGSEVVRALQRDGALDQLSLLGRSAFKGSLDERIVQHQVDVLSPASYAGLLESHDCAICTLGVGQPSKMSKAEFTRIDRDAVIDFAMACKAAGVRHFQLLSSVGADPGSRSFFLRSKGELQERLKALDFERLSLFQPSMILTDKNRYGVLQAMTLIVWPLLGPFMIGPLRRFRGIHVSQLGQAFAKDVRTQRTGVDTYQWPQITSLAGRSFE